MNAQDIRALASEVTSALEETASMADEISFLRRVLTQAVLTHGGVLIVDPALGEIAKRETRYLEFGSGGVRLVTL